MQLKRIKTKKCPKCGCTEVIGEGSQASYAQHDKGTSEHRKFSCGHYVHCYVGKPITGRGCQEWPGAKRYRQQKADYFERIEKALLVIQGPKRLRNAVQTALVRLRYRHGLD